METRAYQEMNILSAAFYVVASQADEFDRGWKSLGLTLGTTTIALHACRYGTDRRMLRHSFLGRGLSCVPSIVTTWSS